MDKFNFHDLKALEPDDVVLRTGCRFDSERQQYSVNIWRSEYKIDLNACEVHHDIAWPGIVREYMSLFVLFYLIRSKNIPPSGEWISEKDIPGGAAFFRGPHTIPSSWIADRFGNSMEAFEILCRKFGGTSVDFADSAFVFKIVPSIPVAVLYWQGDEDFPCEAKLLFDRTIGLHLPLDVIYALATIVCHRLGKS